MNVLGTVITKPMRDYNYKADAIAPHPFPSRKIGVICTNYDPIDKPALLEDLKYTK